MRSPTLRSREAIVRRVVFWTAMLTGLAPVGSHSDGGRELREDEALRLQHDPEGQQGNHRVNLFINFPNTTKRKKKAAAFQPVAPRGRKERATCDTSS